MWQRIRAWWFGPLGASPLGPMGITRMGHHLGYGTAGWGRYWLPDVVQGWLIGAWNAGACRYRGHDWTPDLSASPMEAPITREMCSACSAERPAPAPWQAEPTVDPHRWSLRKEQP